MSSADRRRSDASSAVRTVILPKIREARRIADEARRNLLDVVVWLDEVENDVMRGNQNAIYVTLNDLDLFGPDANRLDSVAREYQPDDTWDW
jgi:hypothetical protein